MTRQTNILSFDEVKANRASTPRVVARSRFSDLQTARPSERDAQPPLQRRSRASLDARLPHIDQAPSPSYAEASRYGYGTSGRRASDRPRAASGDASLRSGNRPSSRAAQRAAAVDAHPYGFGADGAHQEMRRGTRPASSRADSVQSSRERAERRRSSRGRTASESSSFVSSLRKRVRAVKAERQFERTVGARDRAEEARRDPSARAAVYNMRMGATHRKSSAMQNAQSRSSSGFSLPFAIPFGDAFARIPQLWLRVGGFAMVLAVVGVMLFPKVADCYHEFRQLQQLEAEYDALIDYNQQVQAKVDYLKTDEGIEDYARSELGWVRKDEHVVNVEGVESTSASTKSDRLYPIESGSIKAPDTWYSALGDAVFGYVG